MTDSQIVTAKEEGSERTAPRIYVASRASIPARPAMWRAFRAEGYPIVSTWIDEAGEGESASLPDLWRRIHQETRGAALVLYAPPEDGPWKGAFVEIGLALASGGRVFVAGDHRHLGSWVWGPGVTLCADVRDAMDAARAWAESSPARSPSDPLGPAKNARVLATRAADKRAGREVWDHVSAEEARALLDVWAIHADSNVGKAAAAPDLAATVVALSEERDSERANGNDLADAVVRLEAERDRLLRDFTGLDAAGWERERKEHAAWLVAENRGGGVVTCPDCGRGSFADGTADIDLSPRQCLMCELAATKKERDRLLDILACERGERAPEGWRWEDGEWRKGDLYVAHYGISRWKRGRILRGVPYIKTQHTYALEAIEAADLAAGKVRGG